MVSSLEIILVPTLMIFLGYFLKRRDVLKVQDSVTLSKIVLDITLPSLIFINLSKATINSSMLFLPFSALFISIVCIILSYIFSKFRGFSKSKTWTMMIASSMMNTGFLGFPITMGLLGKEGFLNAIFFDLETTVLFVVFGMVLVSVFGGSRKDVLKQSVSFVPLWAVLFALIFNYFNIGCGYVIESVLNYLGDATIPLIMITLGLRLDLSEIRKSLDECMFVSLLRLVISPLLTFVCLSVINFGGLAFKVAVLQSGMSTAMNALVLSINYDLDSNLMSSAIFTDTILALGTLTVISTFLI